jgi:hypothetical protein
MSEEDDKPGMPEEEEESPDIEEELCGRPPTSPLSHPMMPPPGVREEEQCGCG